MGVNSYIKHKAGSVIDNQGFVKDAPSGTIVVYKQESPGYSLVHKEQ